MPTRRSGAGTLARVLRAALLSPLAPPACLGCGRHPRPAGALCAGCRGGLVWLGAEPVWLEPAAGPGGGAPPAGSAPAPAFPLWAPLAYRGGAAALVQALKFRGALGLAPEMAAQIAVNAPPGLLTGAALAPAPLHPARRRRRGFNQAERLAAALAQRTGLPLADVLRRRGARATQMGRPRRERLRSLSGSIDLAPGARPPAAAILVDDVATTGATLRACAEALAEAGVEVRAAVTYARTPGR